MWVNECLRHGEREKESMCMLKRENVCVYAYMIVHVCLCVRVCDCVRERETYIERECVCTCVHMGLSFVMRSAALSFLGHG